MKSVLWRVAKSLPYIEEARCLKVKIWTGNRISFLAGPYARSHVCVRLSVRIAHFPPASQPATQRTTQCSCVQDKWLGAICIRLGRTA